MAFEPIKLTYLLILDVNEGDEWRVNSAVGPPDPSPTAVTAAQNASSKKMKDLQLEQPSAPSKSVET